MATSSTPSSTATLTLTLPQGPTIITNSSTGDTIYMLSNPSTGQATAFSSTGGAAGLSAAADGLLEAEAVLALGGSVTTVAIATTGTAALTIRIGTSLVIST